MEAVASGILRDAQTDVYVSVAGQAQSSASRVAKTYCGDTSIGDSFSATMLIGYARVSANEQDTTAQASALRRLAANAFPAKRPLAAVGILLSCNQLLDHLRKSFRSSMEAMNTTKPAAE